MAAIANFTGPGLDSTKLPSISAGQSGDVADVAGNEWQAAGRGEADEPDQRGHAAGDRLLQIVAHRLTHSVRPGDVVAVRDKSRQLAIVR